MKVSFLRSSQGIPATKSFSLDEGGKVVATSYPNIFEFTSITHEFDDIERLTALMMAHADERDCMLKGQLNRELENESRAGSTDRDTPTRIFLADIDGVKGIDDIDDAISELMPKEFQNVDHIIQLSSSYGVLPEKGLSAHIFWLLEKEVPAPALKPFVTAINLDNPTLRANLSLNKTGLGLHYPLDRTVNQNDKLIYIAKPLLGEGVVDHTEGKRIWLVKGKRRYLKLPLEQVSEERNRQSEEDVVNELREQAGLAKKKVRFREVEGVQICANPDVQTLTTAPRFERGFVYLSMNGGKSYPYWYPQENPKILYNWKGEPPVLLKDFLPDYYRSILLERKKAQRSTNELQYFAFHEFQEDCYYNGYYNPADDTVTIARSGSKDRMRDYLSNYGEVLPDPVPEWTYVFDPQNPLVYDTKNHVINRFQMTEYMRNAEPGTTVPATVERVLRSVTGHDDESYTYFINWLAHLFQHRRKIGTAWVLHGIEGTGKGVLFHKILVPLIGEKYCAIRQLLDFEDQFNDWLQTNLVLFVDEARIDNTTKAKQTVNFLKNLITEPRGRIRAMFSSPRDVPLYSNIIFASNDYDAMHISESDRRFNVAARQEAKLQITHEEVEALEDELQEFANFLFSYKIDYKKIETVMENQAKHDMRKSSLSSIEQFFSAIKRGDLDFFVQFIGDNPTMPVAHLKADFERIMRGWIADMESGEESRISRNDLRIMYAYLQGEKEPTINKFTRMMAHNNVISNRRRIDGVPTHCVTVLWDKLEEDVTDALPDNVHKLQQVKE